MLNDVLQVTKPGPGALSSRHRQSQGPRQAQPGVDRTLCEASTCISRLQHFKLLELQSEYRFNIMARKLGLVRKRSSIIWSALESCFRHFNGLHLFPLVRGQAFNLAPCCIAPVRLSKPLQGQVTAVTNCQ